MIDRPGRRIGQQVLLRDIGDIGGLRILGQQVIERLVLRRPQVGRNRLPPLLGVVEHRIDVIDDAAERKQAMPDDIADTEFSLAALRHGDRSALVRNWTRGGIRLEEHTSELQSLMRHTYSVLGYIKK